MKKWVLITIGGILVLAASAIGIKTVIDQIQIDQTLAKVGPECEKRRKEMEDDKMEALGDQVLNNKEDLSID